MDDCLGTYTDTCHTVGPRVGVHLPAHIEGANTPQTHTTHSHTYIHTLLSKFDALTFFIVVRIEVKSAAAILCFNLAALLRQREARQWAGETAVGVCVCMCVFLCVCIYVCSGQ